MSDLGGNPETSLLMSRFILYSKTSKVFIIAFIFYKKWLEFDFRIFYNEKCKGLVVQQRTSRTVSGSNLLYCVLITKTRP